MEIKEVEVTDDMTLGDYKHYLRSLTPRQRASLEFFGMSDYLYDRSDENLAGDNSRFSTQWSGRMTIAELMRYYGHKED